MRHLQSPSRACYQQAHDKAEQSTVADGGDGITETGDLMRGVMLQRAEVRCERMSAHVKSEQLLFVGEPFGVIPFGQITQCGGDFVFFGFVGIE